MEKVEAERKQVERNDLIEMAKDALSTSVVYTLFASLIYLAVKFNWWIGLVLYLPFAFSLLSRFVLTGFIFIFEVFVLRFAVRLIKTRGLNPSRFDELGPIISGLVWWNFLLAVAEIYLVLIVLTISALLFVWY